MSRKRFFLKKWSLFLLFFLLAGSFFLISLPNDDQTANSQSPQKKVRPTFLIGSPITDPIHESVVRDAFSLLTNYHLNHPDKGMTEECIDALVQGSRAPDNPAFPVEPWEDSYHWTITGCTAQEVWQRSTQQLEWIYFQIMNDCFLRSPELINYTLGVAFHVVADFFAHSSWCDRSGRYISGLDFESPSIYDEWTTYKLSPNVIKPKDKPGDQYFYEAYAAAVEMTLKEYHRLEKRLFNKYPYSLVCENLDKAGVKKTVALDWPEGGPMRILFPGTFKITWDHCGINPDSNIKISLCYNTFPIGEIAEVPLEDREYDWEVGKYYILNNGQKEWHTAPPGIYGIQITYLNDPTVKASTTAFHTWDFRFTNLTGESLNRSEYKNITWETDAFHEKEGTLFLYRNGKFLGRIANLSPAEQAGGSYLWKIGEYIGGTAPIGGGYQIVFGFEELAGSEPPSLPIFPDTYSNPFAIKLPPVKSLTASPGNGRINLTWINPSDPAVLGVMIRYSTSTFPANPNEGTHLVDMSITPGANGSRIHAGLTNGTTYYYSIFTYDSPRNYSIGAQVSAAPTLMSAAIPPVTSLTASPGNGRINLTWINPSDPAVLGVMIRYSTSTFPANPNEGTHLVDMSITPGANGSRLHVSLTNGTTYYYSIFTYDRSRNYSFGAQTSATPALMSATIPPVTSLTASPGNGKIKLTWINPSDPAATTVMIRFSTSAFPANPNEGTLLADKGITPGANDSWTHINLTNGRTYFYTVFAYDGLKKNYSFGTQVSATPFP